MDLAVNSQRYIVPAYIAAALGGGSVVQLHGQEGIGFQTLLRSYLIVPDLPLSERGEGCFLGGGYDFRVVPYQGGIDKLTLDLLGLGQRRPLIPNKEGRTVIEADRNIA